MPDRRDFLQSSLLFTGGVLFASSRRASAAGEGYPANLFYTAEQPGIWDQKIGSHVPRMTLEDGQVTVFTKHGMSEEHFIVRHTLVGADGSVLGSQTFSPEDEEARSRYALPEGYRGRLYATSFCNKHDLWLSTLEV